MKRHYKIPFGAEVERDGVRFRLWVPRAARVLLHLEGDPAVELPMEKKTDGTFVLTTAVARSGTRYRYLADGNPYPDPASRRQPDRIHGPSEVVDPLAYDPMAEATFLMSKLDWSELSEAKHMPCLDHYRALIDLRMREIVPRLAGISGFAGSCRVLAPRGDRRMVARRRHALAVEHQFL